MSVQGLHIVHTYLQWTLDPQYAVCAADCIDLSPCWCQHQLHSNTKRLPMLSNVCICKYKHNDKLTSQPYKDTGTSCLRESTTFRHVNMLTYCTFLKFQTTLHHPDWSILSCTKTLWKSWKVDEETWTMLGQSICNPSWDTKF